MRDIFLFLFLLVTPCALWAQGVTSFGHELHVAVSGSDQNPGTAAKPFATIQKAADMAQPGDKVIVHEGEYREAVRLVRGGSGEQRRIVYRAAPGGKVIIKGPLPFAFAAAQPGVNYISIEGFTISQISPPPADIDGEQPGAIATGGGAYWNICHNTLLDIGGVAISISMTGHRYPESRPSRPAYSDLPTDIQAVGHHRVCGNTIQRCVGAAILGLLHGSSSVIDSNRIEGVSGDGSAGIRLALAVDVEIKGNFISGVSGDGIFIGPLYQGGRITHNVVKDGLHLFDGHGPLTVDNNIFYGHVMLVGAEAGVFVQNKFYDCRFVNDTLPMRPWATSSFLAHSLVIKQTIPVLPLESKWFGNRFIRGSLAAGQGTVMNYNETTDGGFPVKGCPRIDAKFVGIFPLTMQSIEGGVLATGSGGAGRPEDRGYTAWPLTRVSPSRHPGPFVHPGLLHTKSDLQRIKEAVAGGVEPWKSGFAVFSADPGSSASYVPHPAEHVERSLLAGQGKNIGNLEKDGNAAYQNALMWCITGEEAHAKKAVEILDGWSSTLKIFDGTDIELGAGINGLKFANAAELMRATYPAWGKEEMRRCQRMLREVFYPPLRYFALWAHGNWDLCSMKAMMAIGVFCDDHGMFDRAVDFFYNGTGNGSLKHYIVNDSGQVQESGRDQGHTELGIGQLAEVCQMAWSQGLDLYGAFDSRLLLGFEYVARYNLGEDVPFTAYSDQSRRFPATHISDNGRGKLRSIYEMVLNHYQQVGIPAYRLKYTRIAAEKLRPEGPGFGADHPGFGTLLFTLKPLSGALAEKGIPAKVYAVVSPDQSTRLEIAMIAGQLSYRVLSSGIAVLDWSPLGFVLNGTVAGRNTNVMQEKRNRHFERFAWPLGESDTIVDHYNELELLCESDGIQFHVLTRVFNGSVAFRYGSDKQPGADTAIIREEKTGFRLAKAYQIYQYHHESVFTPSAIDTLKTTCDLPATLVSRAGDSYISIGEAANDNYTKAELKKGEGSQSLAIDFARDSVVRVSGAFQTPWRTISISRTAIGLHAFSDLFLRLNPPPSGGFPDWIRPGKLIRAQLSTQSGLDCVDFAASHQFQYILFDAGWYGAEFRTTSDPTASIPAIDMPQVIQKAKEKGIGVILYVNYVGLRRQLDTLLPLYKKWGVAGLKFGFVDGFSQTGLVWLASAIRKVNAYGFILDIHDNYKPTGLSRTYPALLTQEGIRGDENSPDAFHTTVLPFTRFLAGPADFTFCYPNATNSYSKNIKVSKAQQLALTVIYFSPLQSMFWYGKPNDYTDEQDIEFFRLVPTVWNESRYLAGEIGKGISVARRHGSTWFMANAVGLTDWKASVRLDFLESGKAYIATIYEDDGQGGIRKRKMPVKKGFDLAVDLAARSGQAIIIEPVDKNTVSFVHPGLLQSKEDLDRMKKAVASKSQPIYSGYEIFQQNPESHYTYQMKGPLTTVGRNPTIGQGVYDEDANAAYQNAINWAITGDKMYAEKAIQIVNAWSYTLDSITGRDAVLMAGLGPFKMVNAAEILRYTNAGWAEADVRQAESHFKHVIYPVLKDLAPFANGNWDAAAIKTVMSIGVFCNDREMFERALRYYVDGGGNGRLTHYVINENGQIQESGRDQGHTQLGIGLLGDCSEIAWHQGLDLYGYANNRLLKGFEYTARYNLGDSVPFTPDRDRTGKYTHSVISTQGAGQLRAVYEQIYNHYVNIIGLPAPYTTAAAAKIRPEGPGKPGADHPGYGTLFYSRSPKDPIGNWLAAPGAMIAKAEAGGIRLQWVAAIRAKHYSIKRAVAADGPFSVIASNISGTVYTDRSVQSGHLYYYTISASNAFGTSANAFPVAICAGLPAPWRQQDAGGAGVAGKADFDGRTFRIEAEDHFHFTYLLLTGNFAITARFQPQPSSQFTRMGLTIRSGTDSNAVVNFLIYPGKGSSIEAPGWRAGISSGDGILLDSVLTTAAPIATYGRLTGYCWLRLEKQGDLFNGYVSSDGVSWQAAGSVRISLEKNLQVGLAVSSGLEGLSTIVGIDHVTVQKK